MKRETMTHAAPAPHISAMRMPLISVVMPSWNQAQFVEASIDSVLGQNYPNVELIVADGGSNDGTVEILKRRQAGDSRLRWFSRRDRGPAHALNDAMGLVRGTVIGWLNSDDLYTPGAISRAMAALGENPKMLMVYGHGRHVDGNGASLDDYPTLPPDTPIATFKQGCFICQPTMFFRRTAHVLLGSLDEQLKASFDFEYWLRAFSAFPDRIGFIDTVQACSRLHEDCITMRLRRTVALEGMKVLARHLGCAPKEWLLTYVDELVAGDPDAIRSDDMRQHLNDTVIEASLYLAASERTQLEAAIARRLNGK